MGYDIKPGEPHGSTADRMGSPMDTYPVTPLITAALLNSFCTNVRANGGTPYNPLACCATMNKDTVIDWGQL